MSEDRLDRVESRLAEIENRLTGLDLRMQYLERAQGVLQAPPPPVVAPPRFEMPEVRRTGLLQGISGQGVSGETAREASSAAVPQGPGRDARAAGAAPPYIGSEQREARPAAAPVQERNWEYWLGTQVGLKLGGALTLLAVFTFVRWGYDKGWFTPAMIFAGEILFCLGFLAFGWYFRDEREDLGQILTAIGSGGLYLVFAGGHLVQNLYDGNMLVGLFLGLSFVNLGYSIWRGSRPFWYLGFVGGLAAAWMPLDEQLFTLNAILNLAIIVPAALIAARKKWLDASSILWIAGLAALLPYFVDAPSPWEEKVAFLYGASLVCGLAYLATARRTAWDEKVWFGAFMVAATGIGGFAIYHEPIGAWHLAAFGALFGSLALLKWPEALASRNVAGAAIATAFAMIPFCFERNTTMLVFFATAVAAGLATVWVRSKAFSLLSAQQLTLGMLTYCYLWSVNTPYDRLSEVGILSLALVASVSTFFGFARAGQAVESVVVLGTFLVGPLFSRILVVSLGAPEVGLTQPEARVLSYLFITMGLAWLVSARSWASAAALLILGYVVTLGLYVHLAVKVGTTWWFDSAMALALLLSCVMAAVLAAPKFVEVEARMVLRSLAAIVISGLGMRIFSVLLSLPSVGLTAVEGTVYGAAVVALVFSALAFRFRAGEALSGVVSSMAVGSALVLGLWNDYMPGLSDITADRWLAPLTLLGLALMLGTWAAARLTRDRSGLLFVSGVLGMALASRWMLLAFETFQVSIPTDYALSFAWVLYGVALLSLGFRFGVAFLRYVALSVFALTVCKVLVVDMAGADLGLKFGVLLALGLTILGGGYWYIRSRGRLGVGT